MAALHGITWPTTAELHVGDVIDWRGERRKVTALSDTGKPALYGRGNAWDITLTTPAGVHVPMVAAASEKWARLTIRKEGN